MSKSLLIGIFACVILSVFVVNSAYAHGLGGCLAGCPVGGGTGAYGRAATNDMNILALLDILRWLLLIAFVCSMAFGIFVLFKNRSRKVAC